MLIQSPKQLALMVANRRKQLQLSQAAVADLVGLRQATISGFENKPESAQLDTLFHILSAVNLDIQIIPKDKNKTQGHEEW